MICFNLNAFAFYFRRLNILCLNLLFLNEHRPAATATGPAPAPQKILEGRQIFFKTITPAKMF